MYCLVHKSVTVYSSYAMVTSGIPWNMPCITCIFHIHMSLWASVYTKKIQVTNGISNISDEKALHN